MCISQLVFLLMDLWVVSTFWLLCIVLLWTCVCMYFFEYLFWILFFLIIYLFIHLWLCWVLASAWRPSPAAASGGPPSSRCTGPPPSWPLPLRCTGSRRAGSVIVAHGPSRSAACGIPPDQGPNPCPLHWQADSQPLRHQGSPLLNILLKYSLKMLTNYASFTYF